MDSLMLTVLLFTLPTPDLFSALIPDFPRSLSSFSVEAPAFPPFGSSLAPYFFSKSFSLISGSGFAALQRSLHPRLRWLP